MCQPFLLLASKPCCHRRQLYTLFPSCVSPRLGVEPPNSGTDFLLVPYTCSGLVVLFHLRTTKTVENGQFFFGKNWRLPLRWGADCPPCTPLTLSSQNLCDPGMRYHGGQIKKKILSKSTKRRKGLRKKILSKSDEKKKLSFAYHAIFRKQWQGPVMGAG